VQELDHDAVPQPQLAAGRPLEPTIAAQHRGPQDKHQGGEVVGARLEGVVVAEIVFVGGGHARLRG
jgi:hypothetical protein